MPAVSAKLRQLESELEASLFERLPNRLLLTDLGERFFREVEAVFARAQEAVATLSVGEDPSGRLRISMGSDLTWYIAPRIGSFVRKFPRVDLSLQIYKAHDAVAALGKGDLDVSIGVFQKIPKTLEREVVARSTLSLVCPVGHPLLRRPLPKIEDIARHRLIVLQRHAETRLVLDRTLSKMSVRIGSLIEAANCQTAIALVQKGVGVAIIHSLCIRHERVKGVQSTELSRYFPSIDFSLLYRKGGVRSQIMRHLLDEFATPPLPAQ